MGAVGRVVTMHELFNQPPHLFDVQPLFGAQGVMTGGSGDHLVDCGVFV